MTESETLRCATHPDVETGLRCGKCGKPICPKCMVQTPVGARCRECARLYKLPTYRMSSGYYLRAAGAALVMAIVIGIVWGIIENILPFFFLNLLLAAGVGYAIGEVVSRSVNKKRGIWLAITGSIAVVIAYLVNIFTFGSVSLSPFRIIFDLVGIGIGIYMAVTRLR
ncbi:MAG: B-box zinc finger protein [Dehalococcoidales bacterium]|nr:B-box zinc finger protein [Dehalococcoidales bacterium]